MDNEIDFFKQKCKNGNTVKATNCWINNYKKWAERTGFAVNLEAVDAQTANSALENYFCQVVKQSGKNYEPNSLCAMQAGIQRHLKENGYAYSILSDKEFHGSRDVLEGKAKYLREEFGMGKRPNRSESLTTDEEETLWRCGQLGGENSRSLLNTMWFLLTQHFGLRGRQEHYCMKVEDFVTKTEENGLTEYITFSETFTKTRQAGLRQKQRAVRPKMFETKTGRCPVFLFKKYISRRPISLQKNGFFYLAIIDNPQSEIWYKNCRLGINSLNNMMRNMVKKSPLANSEKKLTNHTARKTVVKKLKNARVQKSDIIGITGHSTEAGLDPYDSGDELQQKEYSHAIDRHQPQQPEMPSYSKHSSIATFHKTSLPPKRFNFFSDETYEKINPAPIMNFHNCTVYIGGEQSSRNSNMEKRRKRIRFISSSDESSQEQ